MIGAEERVAKCVARAEPRRAVRVRRETAARAEDAIVDDERVASRAKLWDPPAACGHHGEPSSAMGQLDFVRRIGARRVSTDEQARARRRDRRRRIQCRHGTPGSRHSTPLAAARGEHVAQRGFADLIDHGICPVPGRHDDDD